MHRRNAHFGVTLLCSLLLSTALCGMASAQPGSVLSYKKLNTDSLAAVGEVINDGDELGDAVASLGDLDGAGPSVRAIAVGAIGDDDGGSHRGAVHVLFLDATGHILSRQKISSTQGNFTGVLESDDEFGSSVAHLGDLDGAGPSVAALAVGAVGDDDGGSNYGAVYVLFLNAAGSVLSHQKISATAGNFSAVLGLDVEFGGAVSSVGDLDGAGPSVRALAVGAIADDDGGVNRGAAFILFLNSAGSVLSYSKISSTSGGFAGPLDDNDNFAEDLFWVGDYDGAGPGVATLVVSAVDDDDGGGDRGAIYLLQLNSAGSVLSQHKISNTMGGFTAPLTTMDNFGTSVMGLGDLDGTGPSVLTLAVSAGSDDGAGLNRGAIYLLFLNGTGGVLSHQEISSTTAVFDSLIDDNDEFGSALMALGDLDGPGGAAQTLGVGVGYDDDGGFNRGAIYLLSLEGGSVSGQPVVTAPATASVAEGALLTVNVTASDPNSDPITSLTATDMPAGATFTPGAGNTSGTLNWTPTFAQSGSYTVTFTAANALSGSASTVITVTNVDRAPAVTAPPTASIAEGAPLTVNVTATDPDAQSITSLTATGMPAGATFTPGAGNTSGTLNWTPTFAQSGEFTVTFTAANALSGSANTVITVTNVDRAPVVTAPPTASIAEGVLLTVNVTASDPDGQAITSLSATNMPSGATFTPGAGNTSGTLSWTPTFAQSGEFTVTFTAANALSGSANTVITVTNVDRAPVVTAPPTASVAEGAPLTVNVTASDPDGQAITSLSATNMPSGATFTPGAGNTSGTLNWTPTFAQSGEFTVTFTAANALSGSANTVITVTNVDRAPVVTAPPTASIAEGVLLTVNVTASDPDGQAITSLSATNMPSGATFTPGAGNTSGTLSWTPTFAQSGSFTVTFTATNALSGQASTVITVGDVPHAPVASAPASATTSEGVLLSVSVTAVDPDGDPISSLTAMDLPTGATFTPDPGDTTGTFSWTPSAGQAGTYTVTFIAANALADSASTVITVGTLGVNPDEGIMARPSVVPSPVRSIATLSFSTALAGPLDVELIDLTGRRVRTLMHTTDAPAGAHKLSIDARGDRGERLTAGVYFYLIRSREGTKTGRMVIAR